jgi:hypothetical protein
LTPHARLKALGLRTFNCWYMSRFSNAYLLLAHFLDSCKRSIVHASLRLFQCLVGYPIDISSGSHSLISYRLDRRSLFQSGV